MNRFYRKPKPETMKKNRESYAEIFKNEISWCKDNIETLQKNKHSFLTDMYLIMVTGSRKITPKMADAIVKSIEKCKNSPAYNSDLKVEAQLKIQPILEKIIFVEGMIPETQPSTLRFVQNVKTYVKNNYRITKKQMEGLNKVYKRVSKNLFNDE
jgi:hypothetical protein